MNPLTAKLFATHSDGASSSTLTLGPEGLA